ncbi:MAG: hypothetical protein A2381_15935 [Bdellovibrionales bacterium RIFOXYB1_FULL_37_110]|nr:MAG: hypothetical protein A2417_07785 [Bdellovibrionales bacterium RIFOXYC1_FULL_37_79]OFZ57104.1 MAG: hypothetical protein A2381_15935 [Bdellovibrionales bacterium RIFOXYB1_FULL_37_110]OFZ65412.1 MAG: hypothetical protein A2577_03935 [Bdellovibrionales bacterium RIFOXYD1_FULL_36_51]
MNKIIILLGLCLIFISSNTFCADTLEPPKEFDRDKLIPPQNVGSFKELRDPYGDMSKRLLTPEEVKKKMERWEQFVNARMTQLKNNPMSDINTEIINIDQKLSAPGVERIMKEFIQEKAKEKRLTQLLSSSEEKSPKYDEANAWLEEIYSSQIKDKIMERMKITDKEAEQFLKKSIITFENGKINTDFTLKNSEITLETWMKQPPLIVTTSPSHDHKVIKHGSNLLHMESINNVVIPTKAGKWVRNEKALGESYATYGTSAVGLLTHPLYVWKEKFNTKKCRRIYEVLKNKKEINTCKSSLEKYNKQLNQALLADETSDPQNDKDYYPPAPNSTQANVNYHSKRLSNFLKDHIKSNKTGSPEPGPVATPTMPTIDSNFDFGLEKLMEAKQALTDCDDNGLKHFYTHDQLWKNYELYPKDSTDQEQMPGTSQTKQQ